MDTKNNVKIEASGIMPSDIQKIINNTSSLSKREAKVIIQHEIDFLVCDLKLYHGNYNNNCAWISNKVGDNFNVNFKY